MGTWTVRFREAARALKRDGLTLWYALRDPGTPWWVRALIVFVVGYALSPIDLIPDFIPVLGLLDDLILLPGLIWLALRFMPTAVREQARARAQDHMARRAPKIRLKWGGALIVAIWIAAIAGVGAVFFL